MQYKVTGMFSYIAHSNSYRDAKLELLMEMSDKDIDLYIMEINEVVEKEERAQQMGES